MNLKISSSLFVSSEILNKGPLCEQWSLVGGTKIPQAVQHNQKKKKNVAHFTSILFAFLDYKLTTKTASEKQRYSHSSFEIPPF